MAGDAAEWIGSVFLFIQTDAHQLNLPHLYKDSLQQLNVYRALQLTLKEATEDAHKAEILKVLSTDKQLIMHIKFSSEKICVQFLRSYSSGRVRQSLLNHLRMTFPVPHAAVQTQLRAGGEQLDSLLGEEQQCIKCISNQKPDHLKDEHIVQLEQSLRNLNLGNEQAISTRTLCSITEGRNDLSQEVTLAFQDQQFVDRLLSREDHQKFAKLVGRYWKIVGRTLSKTCRALRDPAIDNLAYEFEHEGLYEQAYQMLLKFIQSEGKKATLSRLIDALIENELRSLAEDLLALNNNEEK
ncbi:tumor necrosis factor receptor type 1-associated DEATH domain protein [Protopterus annectens]|uniref:tumor necrosis factor receptor type 1-associated DEATH domain protein n=1 Tax=Protopterus annectens TaxID=7888 RepID=UPI001CFBE725|nr:tumor necrosis factor receptor type 1-associated DEATH domain protein [Protopterus annectens]